MRVRPIEIVKNALIVLLTVSAVYLVCVYWEIVDFATLFEKQETIDMPVEAADAPKTQEVLQPLEEGVWIGREFRKADTWSVFLDALTKISRSENASAQEITEAKIYMQKESRYLYTKLPEGLPFDGFCKQFGIASAPFANVEAIGELRYYAEDAGAVYLLEGANDKIYRLTGAQEACADLKEAISKEENAFPARQKDTKTYECTIDFTDPDTRESKAAGFAKTFFGNSLDFVRRVEDSQGTLTYMYGYSQKVLTVSRSGSVEYKEELQAADVTQGFYASLGTALHFMAEHGGWYNDEMILSGEKRVNPVLLEGISVSRDHRQGYRFVFGFRTNEELLPEDMEITMELYDGQVTYYKRNIVLSVSETEGEK